ncbi:AhpC/TSA family protein [Kitasatospora sp. NA04385]|uniref:peroxiredoxin-like family protein n=1 Tax=Kitasatospora sp. NA04385 TaxID=2742135 RepID=UPI001590D1D0|nr:peroxiredoxin-like family protein [Kitasatospora sp. NA04385]QKW22891.1 AhpC/TSA family protein [Kitasatospora sp. NA04385]
MSRLRTGTTAPPLPTADAAGAPLPPVPADGLTHLQFRRFAGCPICNLHLRTFAVRHPELRAAGVRETAVFHSPAAELRPYADGLPFPLLADPEQRLYRAYGVERGARALLDPRVWPSVVRGLARSVPLVLRGRERPPAARPLGGRLGLPADFLLTTDGRIAAAHYGTHAADHWSVDQVLTLATEHRATEHRTSEHRATEHQVTEHQVTEHGDAAHRAADLA